MDRHQRSLESRALGKRKADDVRASASAVAGGRGTGRRLVSSSQPAPDIATKPASPSPSSEDEDWDHMADDDQPSDVEGEGEQGNVSVDSSSNDDEQEQGAVELTQPYEIKKS